MTGMAEQIGSGYIDIEVRSDAASEMSRIEKEVDQGLKRIDRKKAEVTLDAESKSLDSKIKKAQADLKKLEGQSAEAKIKGDSSDLDKAIAKSKAELASLRDKKVKIGVDPDDKSIKDFVKRYDKAVEAVKRGEEDITKAASSEEKKRARDRARQANIRYNKLQSENQKLFNKLADFTRDREKLVRTGEEKITRIYEAESKHQTQVAEKAAKAQIAAEREKTKVAQAEAKKRERINDTYDKVENNANRIRSQRQNMTAELRMLEEHGKSLEGVERENHNKRLTESRLFLRRLQNAEREAGVQLELIRSSNYLDASDAQREAWDAELDNAIKHHNELDKLNMRRVISLNSALQAERDVMRKDHEDKAGLLSQYAAQQKRLTRLQERTRGASGLFMPAMERRVLDLDISAAESQLRKLRHRLERVGEPPPHIDIDVDGDGADVFVKMAKAISNTTVRLGPFTTTIAGAARSLLVLGPIVTSLVGSVGALSGAVGSGLGGALGLLGAGVAGVTPLMLGFGLSMVPVVKELAAAREASKKYAEAVRDHGKGSKEATKANEEYQTLLSNLPKGTRKTIDAMSDLSKAWRGATQETARKNFGTMAAAAIATATRSMGMFSGKVNTFSDNITSGFTGWMKRLESGNAQRTMASLFSNINKGVKPAMQGLSSLGSAFGSVVTSFARSATRLNLGDKFISWTGGIAKKMSSMLDDGSLGKITDNLTKNFTTLLGTVRSATNLIGTFFYKSANSGGGMDFLEDLNKGMDSLTQKMRGGGMDKFLNDSIALTKDLGNVLKPIGQVFGEWTTAMMPLTKILLSISAAVAKVVHDLMQLSGVASVLPFLFGAFLTGKAVNGILSTATAMGRLGTAIRGVVAAEGLLKGSVLLGGRGVNSVLGGAPKNAASKIGVLPVPAGGGVNGMLDRASGQDAASKKAAADAAKKAAAANGILAASAARAGAATRAAGAGAKIMGSGIASIATMGMTANPIVGGVALGVAALGTAMILSHKSATKYRDALKSSKEAAQAYNEAIASMPQAAYNTLNATMSLADGQARLVQVEKSLDAARKSGKTSGTAWNSLLREQAQLMTGNVLAQQQQEQAFKAQVAASTVAVQKSKEEYTKKGEYVSGYAKRHRQEMAEAASANKSLGLSFSDAYDNPEKIFQAATREADRLGISVREVADDMVKSASNKQFAQNMADYIKHSDDLAKMQDKVAAATKRANINNINAQRGLQQLGALSEKAGASLLKLKSASPGAYDAVKMNRSFNDREVQTVSQASRSALASGTSEKRVIEIVADSKNADDAIKRLNAAKITPKKVEIATSGGEKALGMFKQLTGAKLTKAQVDIVTKGGPEAEALLDKLLNRPDKEVKVSAKADTKKAEGDLNKVTEKKPKPVKIGSEYEPPKNLLTTKLPKPPKVKIPSEVDSPKNKVKVPEQEKAKIKSEVEPPKAGGNALMGGFKLPPLPVSAKVGKIEQPKTKLTSVELPVRVGKINLPKVKPPSILMPVKVSKFTIPKAKASTVTVPVKVGKVPNVKAPKAPTVTVKTRTEQPKAIRAPKSPAPVKIRTTTEQPKPIKAPKSPAPTKIRGDASGVMSAVNAANNALGSVRDDVTRYITTVYKTVGSPAASRAAGGGNIRREIKVPRRAKSRATGSGMASPPDEGRIARAADRAALSGDRELRGGKVNTPRYLVGEENHSEFVIATNPKYRIRNQQYLVQAINSIGLPEGGANRISSGIRREFLGATGEVPVGQPREVSERGGSAAKGKGAEKNAFGTYTSDGKGFTSNAGVGVGKKPTKPAPPKAMKGKKRPKITNRQKIQYGDKWGRRITHLEDWQKALTNDISRAERGVLEPQEWIKDGPVEFARDSTGAQILDSDGKPITWITKVPNKEDIEQYRDGLNNLLKFEKQYRDVTGALTTELPQAGEAMAQGERAARSEATGHLRSMEEAQKVINRLGDKKNKTASQENSLKKAKHDKKTASKARSEALRKAETFKSRREGYRSSRVDQGQAYEMAAMDVTDTEENIAISEGKRVGKGAHQGQVDKANSDSAGAVGHGESPGTTGAGVSGGAGGYSNPSSQALSPHDQRIEKLGVERSMAEIGQSLDGSPVRSLSDIDAEMKAAHQSRIDVAKAMLADGDVTNDADAYSALASSSSAIKSINDEIANTAKETAERTKNDMLNFTGARDALAKMANNMISNAPTALASLGGFSGTTAARRAASIYGPGPTQYSQSSGPAGVPTGGAGGGSIEITNNFQQQPDPHTWARMTAWELQAAM